MQSHMPTFAFVACIITKKSLPKSVFRRISLSFLLWFLGLISKSLIPFELMFVQNVREGSNFVIFHVGMQFSSQHLLKRLCFPYCIIHGTFGEDLLTEYAWVCQAAGNGAGQGSLASCSPWGRKELDMTRRLNNRNKHYISPHRHIIVNQKNK